MPRRSFVLLVLVMLTGLWTPPQGTKAQTGCPEGECKIYLPAIHTNLFATATVVNYLVSDPPSKGSYVVIEVTNVTDEPITDISVVGSLTSSNGAGVFTDVFAETFDEPLIDVVFPDKPSYFRIRLPSGDPRHQWWDGIVDVVSATYAPQYKQLNVVESEVRKIFQCPDVTIFESAFVLENDNPDQVVNITVALPPTLSYMTFDEIVLEPGTHVRLRVRYDSRGNVNPVAGAECIPQSFFYQPDGYDLSPRGEVSP